MKINNFLTTLALCVGFSSSPTWAMEPDPTAKGQPNPQWWYPSQMLSNASQKMSDLKALAQAAYNSLTIENMKKQISSWAPSRLQALFLAVVGALLAAGYANKETLIDMINQLTPKSPEEWQNAKKMGLAVGAAGTIGGGVYAYKTYFSLGRSIVRDFIDPKYNDIAKELAKQTYEDPDTCKRLIEWAKKTIEQRINAIAARRITLGIINPKQAYDDMLNQFLHYGSTNIIVQCQKAAEEDNNKEQQKVLRIICDLVTQ